MIGITFYFRSVSLDPIDTRQTATDFCERLKAELLHDMEKHKLQCTVDYTVSDVNSLSDLAEEPVLDGLDEDITPAMAAIFYPGEPVD